MSLERIADTCYLDEKLGVAILQPEEINNVKNNTLWIVLNKAGKVIFGPTSKVECEQHHITLKNIT